MRGDHMTSHGNKTKKEEEGWARTKSEKGREVTNTGGGGLRGGKPLPTMFLNFKKLFSTKTNRQADIIHCTHLFLNSTHLSFL